MLSEGVKAEDVYKALEAYFKPEECIDVFEIKGLQYHNTEIIKKVYTSTFASPSVFEEILGRNEHNVMLFSHHPVPPRPTENDPYPKIPEELKKRLKANEISFFAYHIPLDKSNFYSPSNTLGRALGLKPYGEFYIQNGSVLGALCEGAPERAEDFVINIEKALGHPVKLYPYGGEFIKGGRVAIMGGCARNTDVYDELRKKGINMMLTGVTNPAVSWTLDIHEEASKKSISLIGGTHYSTERFSPVAMLDFFKKLGLQGEFIAEAPNLTDM